MFCVGCPGCQHFLHTCCWWVKRFCYLIGSERDAEQLQHCAFLNESEQVSSTPPGIIFIYYIYYNIMSKIRRSVRWLTVQTPVCLHNWCLKGSIYFYNLLAADFWMCRYRAQTTHELFPFLQIDFDHHVNLKEGRSGRRGVVLSAVWSFPPPHHVLCGLGETGCLSHSAPLVYSVFIYGIHCVRISTRTLRRCVPQLKKKSPPLIIQRVILLPSGCESLWWLCHQFLTGAVRMPLNPKCYLSVIVN